MKSLTKSRTVLEGHHHQGGVVSGEEDRIALIEWLNAANGSESYRRVTRLIRDIEVIEREMEAARKDDVYFHPGKPGSVPKEKLRRRRALDKLFLPLESALKNYVFHPRLTYIIFDPRRWWFDLYGDSVASDYELVRQSGRRVCEADAVFGILRLTAAQLIARVRQCPVCGKWLYASPAHKKFCKLGCQYKFFASAPQQKDKRAAYMREYRRKYGEKSTVPQRQRS